MVFLRISFGYHQPGDTVVENSAAVSGRELAKLHDRIDFHLHIQMFKAPQAASKNSGAMLAKSALHSSR